MIKLLQVIHYNITMSIRLMRYKRGVRKAKRLAKQYNRLDGRTYYVMPGAKGSMLVMNRSQLVELRRQGAYPKTWGIDVILKDAIYIAR